MWLVSWCIMIRVHGHVTPGVSPGQSWGRSSWCGGLWIHTQAGIRGSFHCLQWARWGGTLSWHHFLLVTWPPYSCPCWINSLNTSWLSSQTSLLPTTGTHLIGQCMSVHLYASIFNPLFTMKAICRCSCCAPQHHPCRWDRLCSRHTEWIQVQTLYTHGRISVRLVESSLTSFLIKFPSFSLSLITFPSSPSWVKRDSYLPVGSQNLKATTKARRSCDNHVTITWAKPLPPTAQAKLRYDPVELDPEDMCRMASEQPRVRRKQSTSPIAFMSSLPPHFLLLLLLLFFSALAHLCPFPIFPFSLSLPPSPPPFPSPPSFPFTCPIVFLLIFTLPILFHLPLFLILLLHLLLLLLHLLLLLLAGPCQLLSIGCSGHLLSLHEVCPPIHLCSVHHHSNGARRSLEEGIRDAVWDPPHGTGLPWEHCVPQQTRSCELNFDLCTAALLIFVSSQALNKLTSDGHLLDTETYVGGHVEALESGVFRSDLPSRFKLVRSVDCVFRLYMYILRDSYHDSGTPNAFSAFQ